MDSYSSSYHRHKTIHQILGGGHVADIALWKQRNITTGIMLMGVSVWIVFERSGYTLMSLSSGVLLLLITILFIWSKAASLLNRPAPPLPDVYLTEEMVAQVGELARTQLNTLVVICRDVALGKDSRLFVKVATYLLLMFAVGRLTDLVSLCYICLVLLFTIPILYEKYGYQISRGMICVYTILRQTYVKLQDLITMLRKMDLDKIQ